MRRLGLALLVALAASGCVTTRAASATALEHVPTDRTSPEQSRAGAERGGLKHRVQRGQTLYRIARSYGLTVDALMKANGLDDPRELQAGETLTIPSASAPKPIVEHDSPEPVAAARPGSPKPAPVAPKKPLAVGRADGILAWPLRGVLYARFGAKGKEPHDGIDLSAPAGTPVASAQAGKVLYAGEQKGYGLIAIVEHAGGLITLYAHNRDLRVKTGQAVRAGQIVSTVGDSGRTSGPHLHFEVRREGVPVDPLEFLGPVPSPEASPQATASR